MISISDVEHVEIGAECLERWPCIHDSKVTLIDGRTASLGNSFNIHAVVSKLADEKINPHGGCNASAVRSHFGGYATSRRGWKIETAEVVLNKIFSKNN